MKSYFNLVLLALLAALLQLACASPLAISSSLREPSTLLNRSVNPKDVVFSGTSPNPAYVVERAMATFDPGTLRDWYCNDQLNYPWAHIPDINNGIDYLRGVTNWYDAPPRTCVRVSCSWNSGIWLCNDRDDHIYVTCPDIADYANWIVQKCRWEGNIFSRIKGQVFDAGNWNVIIHGDNC